MVASDLIAVNSTAFYQVARFNKSYEIEYQGEINIRSWEYYGKFNGVSELVDDEKICQAKREVLFSFVDNAK
jgi:hypothetical protein